MIQEVDKSSIRDEYYRLLEQPAQRRARGIAFDKIAITIFNLFIVTAGVIGWFTLSLRRTSPVLFWGIALLIGWFFFFFTEEFYHESKRTTRYAFRKYPAMARAAKSLMVKNVGESILHNFPVLNIGGQPYFLVSYLIRQKWWSMRPSVRLTGWILLDGDGKVIRSKSLFLQAFLTLNYSYTGAVEVQKRQGGELRAAKLALRQSILRAEKWLKRQEREFDENNEAARLQQVIEKLPDLYQAVRESLTIYQAREKYIQAMGYSFGREFSYEDAHREELVNRAYSRYIAAQYSDDLGPLGTLLQKLGKVVAEAERWSSRRRTQEALKTLWTANMNVLGTARYYWMKGIPADWEWAAYVSRLQLAEKRDLPIIDMGDFNEHYPFEKAADHGSGPSQQTETTV